MPLLNKRVWILPKGTIWETWIVQWNDSRGQPHRRVFSNYQDAENYFIGLAHVIRRRRTRRASGRRAA